VERADSGESATDCGGSVAASCSEDGGATCGAHAACGLSLTSAAVACVLSHLTPSGPGATALSEGTSVIPSLLTPPPRLPV
jgi:hypothetical protein